MMRPQVLVFDMDGVLVDVRSSYREAARRTAQGYLEWLLGWPPGSWHSITLEDVAALKLASGFNNDWALTTALIALHLAHLPPLPPLAGQPGPTARELLRALAGVGSGTVAQDHRHRARPDVRAFAEKVSAAGGGLQGVDHVLGNYPNRAYLFAEGDLRRTNLVQRLFQECYLGRDLFVRTYGEEPLWHDGEGLIARERLIPSPGTLEALAGRHTLAVATGRPRAEALHALETFGIAHCFAAVVDLEDVQAAEEATGSGPLGKPHPYSLLEAARRAGAAAQSCAYVGDQPDDMRAARQAARTQPFLAIGCTATAEDAALAARCLREAGADLIIGHPDDLLKLG
ncbi:MAG: HAD hydrolase-like protein [Anaerolineae bacterium]|nr:HAD hydrolase-like protein [Anaerolineae bacterium]